MDYKGTMMKDKYRGLERITSTDKTISQLLMEAYDLGVEYGKKEMAYKIASEQNPLTLNTGISDMSYMPPDYRIALTPKLKVIRDLCPEKLIIRHTVRSMQKDYYNTELVLYTSAPVTREDMPGLVYEMLRIENEKSAIDITTSKELYYKSVF